MCAVLITHTHNHHHTCAHVNTRHAPAALTRRVRAEEYSRDAILAAVANRMMQQTTEESQRRRNMHGITKTDGKCNAYNWFSCTESPCRILLKAYEHGKTLAMDEINHHTHMRGGCDNTTCFSFSTHSGLFSAYCQRSEATQSCRRKQCQTQTHCRNVRIIAWHGVVSFCVTLIDYGTHFNGTKLAGALAEIIIHRSKMSDIFQWWWWCRYGCGLAPDPCEVRPDGLTMGESCGSTGNCGNVIPLWRMLL